MRLHELNYKKLEAYPTIKKNEIEQSLVVVKTKTTTERGKRFIPRGPCKYTFDWSSKLKVAFLDQSKTIKTTQV